MSATSSEFRDTRAYVSAAGELHDWISGARVFSLLVGANDSGVLQALHSSCSNDQIAGQTGLPLERVIDLCQALEAHDIVEADGETFRLTPRYALLASADAPIPLDKVIAYTKVILRSLQDVGSEETSYIALSSGDILSMAEGSGISALSTAPRLSPELIGKALPEVESIWKAGARHLEVGCGIGNSLLGVVLNFAKVSAVGVEIESETAREAQRRALQLGISDRVEVRLMDACDIEDQSVYDTVQWSQFFFPTGTREPVLGNIHKALKPGGYLFVPWIGSVSPDTEPERSAMLRTALRALGTGGLAFAPFLLSLLGDTPARRNAERRYGSLLRCLFGRWGVPVRTLTELRKEIESSGFSVVRISPMPVGSLALTRGFLLVQKGS